MGKKINPKILRLNQTRSWDSIWFSDRQYKDLLRQDLEIKAYLKKLLREAFISRIILERTGKELNVIIIAARPGVIIGKQGGSVETLKKNIFRKFVKNPNISIKVTIKEVGSPNLDAEIVGQGIRIDIEKRVPFRKAMKQAISKVEKARAKGVKVEISGRLNGAEIARTEKLLVGKVPLHTIRADVDYAYVEALTIYGIIGIKVWIYRGDVFHAKKAEQKKEANIAEEKAKKTK